MGVLDVGSPQLGRFDQKDADSLGVAVGDLLQGSELSRYADKYIAVGDPAGLWAPPRQNHNGDAAEYRTRGQNYPLRNSLIKQR